MRTLTYFFGVCLTLAGSISARVAWSQPGSESSGHPAPPPPAATEAPAPREQPSAPNPGSPDATVPAEGEAGAAAGGGGQTAASGDGAPSPTRGAAKPGAAPGAATWPFARDASMGRAAAVSTAPGLGPGAADARMDAPAEAPPEVKKPPWKKKPKVRIHAYVAALFELSDEADDPAAEFSVRNARLQLHARQGKLLQAAVEGEFAQELGGDAGLSVLRDAFVRIKPLRALRLKLGQFKRPFSRLELEPRRKLRLIRRGLGNAWIIEELGYGDRDIGLQLDGRFGEATGLGYAVGVFNGRGRNRSEDDPDGSKDFVFRVDSDPTEWLSVGLNASYKWFDTEIRPLYPRSALMGGGDLLIRVGDLRLLGEGLYGENHAYTDGTRSWNALLMASYEIPLQSAWKLELEPLAKGELLMIQHDLRDGHATMATLGSNLHVGKYFRLMVQGELIRYGDRMPEPWDKETRLSVLAAMSTR